MNYLRKAITLATLSLILTSAPLLQPVNAKSVSVKPTTQNQFTWELQTIEPGEPLGTNAYGAYRPDVVVDTSGTVHVAYYYVDRTTTPAQVQIRYAHNLGGTWNREIATFWDLSPDFFNYINSRIGIALDLDTAGLPHVAFTNTVTGPKLNYAFKSSTGQWTTIANFSGYSANASDESLIVDGQNRVHIAFHDYTVRKPIYLLKEANTWVKQDISPAGTSTANGRSVQLRLTSSGTPVASYVHVNGSGFGMSYAQRIAGVWQAQVVTQNGVLFAALELDSADNPRISYVRTNTTPPQVRYTYFDGAAWQDELVASTFASDTDLTLDLAGTPHISFAYGENLYAHKVNGTWQLEQIGNYPIQRSTIFTRNQLPYMVFAQGTFVGPLQYAVPECDATPQNVISLVSPSSSGYPGVYDIDLAWSAGTCAQSWSVYLQGDDVVYPTDGNAFFTKEQLEPGAYTFEVTGYNDFYHGYSTAITVEVTSVAKSR